MKILAVSDLESKALWDYYRPEMLEDVDLILSCGDLDPRYLSFLVTMAHCPLFYVHGNHDGIYAQTPPEGCECIEDRIVEYSGLRILGLGGSHRYNDGPHQYTQKEMARRLRRTRFRQRRCGGVDVLLTHAPARGLGDDSDPTHEGFDCFRTFLEEAQPQLMIHGHVHPDPTTGHPRRMMSGGTLIINAFEKQYIDTGAVL